MENKKKLYINIIVALLSVFLFVSSVKAQNIAKHFKNKIATKYFVFYYNDDNKRISKLAKFSDGFIDFINREFFEPRFNYPIYVYVLKNRKTFKHFLINVVELKDPPDFGIYFSSLGCFITYENSGLGTFAHEIMHPLISRNLSKRPEWANEGIPSFFEKIFGYWDGKNIVLEYGFHNPWRIKRLKQKLHNLNLENIAKAKGNYGTSEKRLVSVFLHKHGKLKKYINLVKNNGKRTYATFFEAAFDKKFYQIEPLWEDYLKKIDQNKEQIYTIPPSQIFESKQEFEQFKLQYDLE